MKPAEFKAVSGAFEKRWRSVGSGAEKERAKGVKRVDFLVGRARVDGVNKMSGMKEDHWMFTVR